jgi:hypothetical protein
MHHSSYEAGGWTDWLPPWARVADVASMTLVVVAMTIAMTGGFRARIAGWHVALTSPLRLLAWAAAIVVVRHAIVRRHSLAAHAAAQLAAVSRLEAVRTSMGAAVVTRVQIFLVGYLALSTIGYAPGAQPFHDFASEWMNLPLRWDAGWYLQIATSGYQFAREAGAELQQNIVFFPAYPLLVRFVALLLGKSMGAFVAGATLVSIGCFVIALVYCFRMAARLLDSDRATVMVWLIATYPFALFFGAIYSESLFLAASAGAFDHLQRREWWRAAAWAFVLGLARPQGWLVALPLALAAIEERRRGNGIWLRVDPVFSAAAVPSWRAFLVATMPLAGVACYSLFVWHLAGHPLAWASGQAAWGRHYTGLVRLVADRYNFISAAGIGTYVREQPYDVLNGLGLVLALASVVPLATKLSPALAVLVLVDVLPGAAAGGLLSMGRFSSVAFPMFLWLSTVVAPRHRVAWMTVFASLQSLAAALFYTWRPLF